MALLLQIKQRLDRQAVLGQIRRRLDGAGDTLADAIAQRDLYFRISVVGTCNLSCTFCHNEGAPTTGRLDPDVVETLIACATELGFTRVQFTGGEPLLHNQIAAFVRRARRYSDDVGITTNGTLLWQRLPGLMSAGVQRLHVSLQTEPLLEAGGGRSWGVPDWLAPTVEQAQAGRFSLRLNLPIPADSLAPAEDFLRRLTAQGVSVKAFSILPEGDAAGSYPLAELEELVRRVNRDNAETPAAGHVELRGFRPPSGIRCDACPDRARCKEQSHSLRVGADLVLRPCLATRDWDLPAPVDDRAALLQAVEESALLALDYRW